MKPARARSVGAALAALAAASIAVTALALAARAWWVAELFTHFRLQLAAGQAVVVAGLLMLRHRRMAAVAALAAGLNAAYVVPVVWHGAGTAAASGASTGLSVMTVNVAARNDEHERLVAAIRRERPDLILVVEFTARWRAHLRRLDADYAHRELLPQDGPFGLALLSRYPVEIVARAKLGTTPAVDARIAGPSGPFRVLGVHLKPPMSRRLAAERNAQLAQLAAWRNRIDEPLIVIGDFNLTPYSPYYADWIAATRLTDTLAGHGPGITWPTFAPVLGIAIDHCFVSDEFSVVERRHLGEFGSDHYPVLVRLRQESRS